MDIRLIVREGLDLLGSQFRYKPALYFPVFVCCACLSFAAEAAASQTYLIRASSYQENWHEEGASACGRYTTSFSKYWTLPGGGSATQDGSDDCWPGEHKNEYHIDYSWPSSGWPLVGAGAATAWEYYSDEYYTAGPYTVEALSFPWEHCSIIESAPNGGVTLYSRMAQTMVEIVTGESAGSTGTNFYKIHVGAQHSWTGEAIAPTNISVMGSRLDANGDLVVGLGDNSIYNLTPDLPPAFTNYTFFVDAIQAKLKILQDGADITDLTQTIYVGQEVNLLCVLDPPIAPLTNFLWTIPGNRIRDFVLSDDPLRTNGMPLYLANLTNASVLYYWVDKTNQAQVRCAATIAGHPASSKSTFTVLRPSADFFAQITDIIDVGNGNFQYANSAISGTYLHFGGWTNAGMTFTYTNVDLKGYSREFFFLMVQVGTSQAKWYETNALDVRYFGAGLDTAYPYKDFFNTTSGTVFDSPFQKTTPAMYQLSRGNNFKMFLMFQPHPPSIPVPIKLASWSWLGVATNSPWAIVPHHSSRIIRTNNADVTSHPSWFDNLVNRQWTTNSLAQQ